MRKHGMPDVHVSHPNVTPLIDIVMCLIIFFMLVARIGVATGVDHNIKLPKSNIGMALSDLGNTITLNVSQVGMSPKVSARDPAIGEDRVFNLPADSGTLVTFMKTLRGTNDLFKVIIRADKSTPYRCIEPVLQACASANVKDYNFETEKQEGEEVAQ